MMQSASNPFAVMAGATAVVTGAARGIGYRIASTLQEVGMTVVLVDRDGDELERAAKDLSGGQVVPVVTELTEPDGLAGVEAELAGLPPLRVWVNNAGVVSHQAVEDVDLAEFERVLRVNTESALRGSQVAFAAMRAEDAGVDRAIVNLSSLLADKALPERMSYATSKNALQTVTRYAAQEWGRYGIRVNAVSPGYVDTRLTAWPEDDPRQIAKRRAVSTLALRRAGTTDDIANAVLFLASPLAAYVTGTVLRVDGGWHLA
jgi:3-oxoacyl-[acyl-carrier protein] reductase